MRDFASLILRDNGCRGALLGDDVARALILSGRERIPD